MAESDLLRCPWCREPEAIRPSTQECAGCGRPVELRAGRWHRGPLRIPGTHHIGAGGLAMTALGGLTALASLVVATSSVPLAVAAAVGGAALIGFPFVARSTFGVYADEHELCRRGLFAERLARRAYVLRVTGTVLALRVDLASGAHLELALEPLASPEPAIQALAMAWPDLEPWGTRALFRRPPRAPRSPELPDPRPRGRVRLARSGSSDGYRDDPSEATRVIHDGKRASWTIERVGTTVRLVRPELPVQEVSAPLVSARAETSHVVILLADEDIVLACDGTADAQEAARLVLRFLVDAAPA